jgi:hypothetical protein
MIEGCAKERKLEIGDAQLAPYVRRWRAALADVPGEGYQALVDATSERQADRIDVDVSDWILVEASHLARAHTLLAEIDKAGLGALWDEAHTLGWLHQHFGEIERDASNRAHTEDEAKHVSQTATTQLYTPRWIADYLARTCLDEASALEPRVCDPAVGGGQMLLAGLDGLVDRGEDAAEAAKRLHGVDLDGRAVEVARRSLSLSVARHLGQRDAEAEAAIWANLRVADGLFDELGSFDIVVTNPPYMGSRSMPNELKKRVRADFRPFHADLYTAFIRRCHSMSTDTVGVLAQQTVWFLSRFEKARNWLLDEAQLVSFMHLGPHAFATLSGEKASVVAFVQRKSGVEDRDTTFVDVRECGDAQSKLQAFADRTSEVTRMESTAAFDILPGRVIAHWLPERLRRHFQTGPRLADIADIPGSQNKTGKNRRYVKKWGEVDLHKIRSAPQIIGDAGSAEINQEQARWVFYSKGGRFSPWWGNWQNVVDWSEEARRFYADNRTSNLLDETWWFKEGICYTDFGGRTFNARLMPAGCVFDMAGPAIFLHDDRPDRLYALLAVLNSTPVRALLNAMNPSLHYQVRDLRNLPVPQWSDELEAELARRARELVAGMKSVAAFVPQSPRTVGDESPDVPGTRDFLARQPALEHQLDRLVCDLYECPELLVSVDQRPVHHALSRIDDVYDPVRW